MPVISKRLSGAPNMLRSPFQFAVIVPEKFAGADRPRAVRICPFRSKFPPFKNILSLKVRASFNTGVIAPSIVRLPTEVVSSENSFPVRNDSLLYSM